MFQSWQLVKIWKKCSLLISFLILTILKDADLKKKIPTLGKIFWCWKISEKLENLFDF